MADAKVTVKSGQTLSSIAKANGTTVAAIKKANPVLTTNPKYNGGNTIFAGTKLTIPSKAPATATAKAGATTTTTGNKPATTNLPYTGGASTTNLPYTGGATVVPMTGVNNNPNWFSGNTGASAGSSTTVPMATDKLSMAQLQAQFGITAAVINNNPSLLAALNRILGKDANGNDVGPMVTDPALMEAIVKGTSWYRDQTDTQRTYDYYRATNPGQFAADLQKNASNIVKQYASMGLNISANEAIEYANNMMKQVIIKDGKVVRFDQDYLNKLMADSIKFVKTNSIDGRVVYTGLAGKLETMASKLYTMARDYGFEQTTSNANFGKWFEASMKGLVAGTLNPEDVDNDLQARAKSFAPGLSRFIDQGQTLREAADPWLKAIADTWEMDVDQIDLNDDYVQRAINMQDEKGNFTTMNLYDTKKLARRSGKWDTTQTAKEEKTSIASRILKDFGFLG
jgi:LysM repeat protein